MTTQNELFEEKKNELSIIRFFKNVSCEHNKYIQIYIHLNSCSSIFKQAKVSATNLKLNEYTIALKNSILLELLWRTDRIWQTVFLLNGSITRDATYSIHISCSIYITKHSSALHSRYKRWLIWFITGAVYNIRMCSCFECACYIVCRKMHDMCRRRYMLNTTMLNSANCPYNSCVMFFDACVTFIGR